MTNTQVELHTVDELLQLSNEDKHYELIKGELVEMSPTNELHGVLTLEIARLILNHVRANKLGRVYAAETGFVLSTTPDTVLAPDVAYTSAERVQPLTEKFSPVAPDLAVEVVSPGNSASEMNEKTALYFEAGTRQVWIVYPKTRTIHVYTSATTVTILTQNDTLDASNVVPGFKLSVADIFAIIDS